MRSSVRDPCAGPIVDLVAGDINFNISYYDCNSCAEIIGEGHQRLAHQVFNRGLSQEMMRQLRELLKAALDDEPWLHQSNELA